MVRLNLLRDLANVAAFDAKLFAAGTVPRVLFTHSFGAKRLKFFEYLLECHALSVTLRVVFKE